jgi:surface antigen
LDQFQSFSISEDDVIAAALDASKLNALQSSRPTSYSSSSRNTVPVTAGSSASTSQPQSQSVVRRPTVTSQLGGAWLTVLNADDEDKVEKEKMAIAKAEAAAEAKKSVDVVWYDKVRPPHGSMQCMPADTMNMYTGLCYCKTLHLSGEEGAS